MNNGTPMATMPSGRAQQAAADVIAGLGPETSAAKLRNALGMLSAMPSGDAPDDRDAQKECLQRVTTLVAEALHRCENQRDLIDLAADARSSQTELKQARRLIERQQDELRKALNISRAPWPKGMVQGDSRDPAKRDTLIVTLSDGSVWEGTRAASSPGVHCDLTWLQLEPVPTTRAGLRREFEERGAIA